MHAPMTEKPEMPRPWLSETTLPGTFLQILKTAGESRIVRQTDSAKAESRR